MKLKSKHYNSFIERSTAQEAVSALLAQCGRCCEDGRLEGMQSELDALRELVCLMMAENPALISRFAEEHGYMLVEDELPGNSPIAPIST